MEDLGILALVKEIQKLPKFQCPRNMVRGKSDNLLPYKIQSGWSEGPCSALKGLRTYDLH